MARCAISATGAICFRRRISRRCRRFPRCSSAGVVSFKIEGRLKSPEYVAAVCQVYRKAIDAALAERAFQPSAADRYQLEMTFSRGLYSGWMHGVNHQELVSARFGKKRGPFAGRIERVGPRLRGAARRQSPLKPGDGVVFDTGGDTNAEQGGRIYEIKGAALFLPARAHRFRAAASRRSHLEDGRSRAEQAAAAVVRRASIEPRRADSRCDLRVTRPARASRCVVEARPASADPRRALRDPARKRRAPRRSPTEKLREHLGRFGESGYALGELENALEGEVILPIGELNRLRRELVFQLDAARDIAARGDGAIVARDSGASSAAPTANRQRKRRPCACSAGRMEQLDAALAVRRARDLRRFRGHPPLQRRRRARARGGQPARRSSSPRRAFKRPASRASSS